MENRGAETLTNEERNIALVRSFFQTIAEGAGDETLETFYAPDVVQEEFPNRFVPEGATRGLRELSEAAARGRQAMASQTFEILDVVASGDIVVVEAAWSGTLAVGLGEQLPAGTVMRARFAQFFEIRDGRIAVQRNYDCFYPW